MATQAPVREAPLRLPGEEHTTGSSQEPDLPWVTIVWDDPVNLMRYVTYVFQTVFGYSEAKATELMLQVHNDGKAVVSSGSREKVETDVVKLHQAGLWATMQQAK
ncbi:ATP-dependent Clp protease adaptor protein ClpS [Segniliparus rotundus DSM 44985]|uniref:ATP-dependent Clp protease adapter protein ClpS n=1 Tax=Segniliparus rotundus (strain ATCC BAA-972 / CDC 1076 / CIP 108378 / DSM 44985 / JCM 13578) TaxID=640132 RepID=D6Z7P8_SEGRD|nr:ATP-dependent Clp protease adaptor protein ClpS [Segniliparus rotundus DSM 44985]